jgi:hypothetical protein
MLSEESPLDIDQAVAFRQEVSDERTLNDRQAPIDLLSASRQQPPREDDPRSRLGIMYVLHQAQVVQLPFDAAPDVLGFADVESLEARTPLPPQDVDTGLDWKSGEIDLVHRSLTRNRPERDWIFPLHLQLYPTLAS